MCNYGIWANPDISGTDGMLPMVSCYKFILLKAVDFYVDNATGHLIHPVLR